MNPESKETMNRALGGDVKSLKELFGTAEEPGKPKLKTSSYSNPNVLRKKKKKREQSKKSRKRNRK